LIDFIYLFWPNYVLVASVRSRGFEHALGGGGGEYIPVEEVNSVRSR